MRRGVALSVTCQLDHGWTEISSLSFVRLSLRRLSLSILNHERCRQTTMTGQSHSHPRKRYVPPVGFILILFALFNILDRNTIDLDTDEDELIYDNQNENHKSSLVEERVEMPSWRSTLWKITEKPDKPPDSVLFWHIPKV